MNFVPDNSVTMRRFFGDGKPRELAYAGKVLDAMKKSSAIVPVTWALEVANVHVEYGDKVAKYWLDPVEMARSVGFRSHELTKVRAMVLENRRLFLEKWNEHFGNTA